MYPYAAEDITTHDTGKPGVLAIYADSRINGAPPLLIGVARARISHSTQDVSWEIAVVGGGGGVGDVVPRDDIPLAAARICMHYARRAA